MLSIIENEKSTRYFSRLLFHDSDELVKQGEINLSKKDIESLYEKV